MKPGLTALLQSMLPQRLLGRIVYRAARSRRPWLRSALINGFCRLYAIDLDEAERSDPAAYASFNDFFTRALKPGARTLPANGDVIASPVDGTLTEFGRLERDQLLQAKGMPYSLTELVDEAPEDLEPFIGGHYATVYLAPHNYHRIHSPLAATLRQTRYIPGRRFAVNRATAGAVARLFCRNERAVLWLETACGPCLLVMVGALNVASLGTVTLGEIASGPPRLWHEAEPPAFAVGDELGRTGFVQKSG